MKYEISLLQQKHSIEQKMGVNAIDTLRQQIALGERRMKLSEQELTDMRELLTERREQLTWLEGQREKFGGLSKEGRDLTQEIDRVEQQIRVLEDAIRNSGQASTLLYFQLEELKRQLQEMQSPILQIESGFRRLQVQWENQANDFEGLTVRMGTSFENNL
ncbi:MAG: hypothetical protein GWN64_10955, partial [Candidatus Thorarchaeota archaeon]|nr:hypothetical protein [Candidatus Thorarchaeota archaeon]